MADPVILQGNVRQTSAPNLPAGQLLSHNINNRADLLVAQSLPPYAELVRMGVVWTMRTANASAFDYVAAMPTTLATAILYNGEAACGKSYVILSMFLTTIVSTAAAGQLGLLAQFLPGNGNSATAPTHSATTTILTSNSGKTGYGGAARRARGGQQGRERLRRHRRRPHHPARRRARHERHRGHGRNRRRPRRLYLG